MRCAVVRWMLVGVVGSAACADRALPLVGEGLGQGASPVGGVSRDAGALDDAGLVSLAPDLAGGASSDGATAAGPDGGASDVWRCTDGVKDGWETDVDCGGYCPAACAAGHGCGHGNDCTSYVCTAGVCQPPRCNDGVKNGDESDVDCGGSCPACSLYVDGTLCGDDSQCESGFCSSQGSDYPKRCMPSCDDRIRDGRESDVDCGGVCPPCGANQRCATSADCQPGLSCSSNTCL